jgi:hypothetical protein
MVVGGAGGTGPWLIQQSGQASRFGPSPTPLVLANGGSGGTLPGPPGNADFRKCTYFYI